MLDTIFWLFEIFAILGAVSPAIAQRAPHAPVSKQRAAIVIDAKGKKVGNFNGQSLGNLAQLVLTNINGTVINLPATQDGFLDEANGGFGFLLVMYESSDCSGPPNISLGAAFDPISGAQLALRPLVQTTFNGGSVGSYIFDGTLYYAGPPISLMTFGSEQSFVDPSGMPLSPGCVPIRAEQQIGGPVTTFDLKTLGLTPPFSVQQ
jgi:hypothetical protein